MFELAYKIVTSYSRQGAIKDRVRQTRSRINNQMRSDSREFQAAEQTLRQALQEFSSVPTHGVREVGDYRRGVLVELNNLTTELGRIKNRPAPAAPRNAFKRLTLT